MATYKGIKGVKVVTKATDPTASEAEGTVWYNSTSPSALKYSIAGAGAWASGGNMNTGRTALSSFGIQTAAMAAAGYITPTVQNVVEEYNGTSWSVKNTVTVARRLSHGAGTTTAGIIFGGLATPTSTVLGSTETWDGTSWTAVNPLVNPRKNPASAQQGTTTAALAFSGDNVGIKAFTEEWVELLGLKLII